VRAHLDEAAIDRLLDPDGYLGSAGRFIDRALAAHHARTSRSAG
jgi:3-carboxy-cis,cis-muconate cycloisomerase